MALLAELATVSPDATTQPFWDACRKRELRLQRCADCGRFRQPPGLTELSETSTDGLGSSLATIQDYGHLYAGSAPVTHHLTIYRAPSGALVFGAGTVNLFADMGAQPTALQTDLVPG